MKVTMYKAADGRLFNTQKELDAHNAVIRLRPLAQEFVLGLNLAVFDEDDEGNYSVHRGDLAEFIVTHADSLRKVLSEALVVRRPRKAKKAAKQADASESQLAA